MRTFYVVIEAEGGAANAPTLHWSQGGPGASSLYGLLIEFGPLLVNAAAGAAGSPSLVSSPHQPIDPLPPPLKVAR